MSGPVENGAGKVDESHFPKDGDCVDRSMTKVQLANLKQQLNQEIGEACRCYQALDKERLDLLEVCSPWDSPLGHAVQEAGGRVERLGLHNGYDLSTRSGTQKAMEFMRRHRPRHVHFSPPCFPWSPMRNACRTEEQYLKLQEDKIYGRKILKNCRKLLELQLQELGAHGSGSLEDWGSHASGEQPLRAQSWKEESWRAMTRMAGGRFRSDGCAWGLRHPQTRKFMQKSWGWFSTCQRLRQILARTCNHQPHEHSCVEGSVTALTAQYPVLLCKAVAKWLMEPTHVWQEIVMFARASEASLIAAGTPVEMLEASEEANQEPEAPRRDENHEAPEAPENLNEPEGPRPPEDPNRPEEPSPVVDRGLQELRRKIRIIHSNLGHPSKAVLIKMLRDAQASPEAIAEAEKFECPQCRTRGRIMSKRPSAPHRVTEKWHTLSVDTFWWHSPHKDEQGRSQVHGVGVSLLDEATDFHVAKFIRLGPKKQGSVSAKEFREMFSQDWIRVLPTPKVVRFDDEGCFRDQHLIEWFESSGIQPQVIAGEAPWQNGKHSRHLETLKENLTLLALERPPETPASELLALSLGAKNEMHQVRGYSPNQWAFGQAKGRVESVLQQGENQVLQSRRESGVFEEQLQVALQARQTFLKADARRRLARAVLARSRRTEVFETGNLVYYWRRGRGVPEGLWHGPARVVCVEKTGESQDSQLPGSIVWIVHGIVLYRCAPEQLRHVTHDLGGVDECLHANMTPSQVLQRAETSMNYRDITRDAAELSNDHEMHDEDPGPRESREPEPVTRRVTSKQPPLTAPRHVPPRQPEEGSGPQREGESSASVRPEVARDALPGSGGARPDDDARRQAQRLDPQASDRREGGLRPVDPRPPTAEREVHSPPGVRSPSSGTQVRPENEPAGRGRQDFEEHSRQQRERRREGHGSGPMAYPQREGEPSQSHGSGDGRPGDTAASSGARASGAREEPAAPHRPPPREASEARGSRDDRANGSMIPETGARSRSRTPARSWILAVDGLTPDETSEPGPSCSEVEDPESCGNAQIPTRAKHAVPEYKTGCFSWQKRPCDASHEAKCKRDSLDDIFPQKNFVGYVGTQDVVEIVLNVAPRDVHLERKGGFQQWKLNEKVKRRAEVSFRKLHEDDKPDFVEAMKSEIGSYLEKEAVELAVRNDIPRDRVLPMRWVLTWKAIEDGEGEIVGRKPKARLIIKGFCDPDLLHLKRESPTLSTQNRNLLLALAAQRGWKVNIGDIKTAFLNGDQTERSRNIGADPPEDVRRLLGMKPWEIFRILKAVYGLLHAPKVWYDKLAQVLESQGWQRSRLEPCVWRFFDLEKNLIGLIGCHVDDLVCAGEGSLYQKAIGKLRDSFPFGSWRDAQRESILFCGCELKQHPDFSITLQQERYACGVNEVNISQERKQQRSEPLSPDEKRQFRAVLGALSWRGTQSAPWLCASVSWLQGAYATATVEDLCFLNKLVRLQRQHCEQPLTFHSGIEKPLLVTFCDASWASRKDGSSQGGMYTMLADASVLEGLTCKYSPIMWQSRKLPRVARSSTSAEVQMASSSTDSHEFVKQILLDWFNYDQIHHDQIDAVMSEVPSVLVCDSRNLFDALSKIETSGLHLEEKRTAIEVLSIRERTRATGIEIRWVDGDQQLADGLSKVNEYEQLLKVGEKGLLSLVFDPQFTSAKKKRAALAKNRRVSFEEK